MKYCRDSHCSAYYPKVLGTYEKELSGAICAIIGGRPPTVIDVGAAEGYYAVGLALRLREANFIAFEAESRARDLLRELCAANGCSGRIGIKNSCDSAALLESTAQHQAGAIIMDVEGAEASILTASVAEKLKNWTLLVEIHELEQPGCGELLRRRFAATHIVDEIQSVERKVNEFPLTCRPAFRWLMQGQICRSMSEWRGRQMTWLHIVPRRQFAN
jgi:precorrin-6B methylase 2